MDEVLKLVLTRDLPDAINMLDRKAGEAKAGPDSSAPTGDGESVIAH
jgi:hypothetical protein